MMQRQSQLPVEPGGPHAAVGRMVGTPIVAATRHFQQRYGRAAIMDVASRMAPQWRYLIDPNADVLGLLGARWYPYGFIAEFMNCARVVVRGDEDEFIREMAFAGIDNSMSTVMRAMARWFSSPRAFAERSQDSWRLFHDSGVMTVPTVNETEVRRRVADWQGHNVIVCKIVAEVFARTFSKTGVTNVRVRREECVSWDRDACVFHVRWD
jgi:hypothetical protein